MAAKGNSARRRREALDTKFVLYRALGTNLGFNSGTVRSESLCTRVKNFLAVQLTLGTFHQLYKVLTDRNY